MSWQREPLWTKARLFFERAFQEPRDGPWFGLWCAMGLELLARAAIASVSPTLLAESDSEHRYLLHALGRGGERVTRKSISTATALSLCRTLFTQFTEEDFKISLALTNRRNEELHSGAAAFENYPVRQWIVGFYSACKGLSEAMNETIESLFEKSEAEAAIEALTSRTNDVMQKVKSRIAAHQKVFEGKSKKEKDELLGRAVERGEKLSYEHHHRVECPACRAVATVKGHPIGRENVEHEDSDIVVRRAVSPDSFECVACDLKLESYAELDAAGLGGHYTRRTTLTPEDYYGLVDLGTLDMSELVTNYLERNPDFFEDYDNE